MAIETVLSGLGVNIAASAIYDFLKSKLTSGSVSRASVEAELQGFLRMHGVKVSASTVIDVFASQGLLSIQGSSLYAPNQVAMGAGPAGQFVFGNNSSSRTDRSSIDTGHGAFIQGSNAAIVQNPDGSISFMVGRDDHK